MIAIIIFVIASVHPPALITIITAITIITINGDGRDNMMIAVMMMNGD